MKTPSWMSLVAYIALLGAFCVAPALAGSANEGEPRPPRDPVARIQEMSQRMSERIDERKARILERLDQMAQRAGDGSRKGKRPRGDRIRERVAKVKEKMRARFAKVQDRIHGSRLDDSQKERALAELGSARERLTTKLEAAVREIEARVQEL